jgi:HK97 family phage major capsid protein
MLINCVHRISPQYRMGSKFSWVMHDSLIQHIRKLKVNTNDYIWKVSDNGGLSDGVPGTIYGIPYRLNAYINTATDTTNGAVVAVVGNFDYFEMFERTGVTSMMDPYSAAATQETTLYLHTRWDSHIMLPEAFASITV